MAKGRRVNSNRSERLLGTGNNNSYYNHVHQHHSHDHENGTIADVLELREEDVWSIVDNTTANYHHHRDFNPYTTVDSGRRQEQRHVGGLSMAFEDKTLPTSRRILHQCGGATYTPRVADPARHVATSAPVNVPDWSKILHGNTAELMHDLKENNQVGDDDSVVEPPHEFLARSRQKNMNAFSVFEGVGRTLKGRDLSRVRDAVWSQTGFEG